MLFLAADIADIPADFIKSALMLFGFVIVIYMQWQNSQIRRREVSGSMTVTEGKEFADKAEVEKRFNNIEDRLATLFKTNTSEHEASRKAANERVLTITKNIDDVESKLENRFDEMRERITEKIDHLMQHVHDKVNAVALSVSAHTAQIEDLKQRDYAHEQQIVTLRTASTPKPR